MPGHNRRCLLYVFRRAAGSAAGTRSLRPHKSVSSFIQTILLVLESHQICVMRLLRNTRADYTANRELHPALKTFPYSNVQMLLYAQFRGCQEKNQAARPDAYQQLCHPFRNLPQAVKSALYLQWLQVKTVLLRPHAILPETIYRKEPYPFQEHHPQRLIL